MENPSIIFTQPGKAVLCDKEMPTQPIGKEVLIRVMFTTVSSGTERANLLGDENLNIAEAKCPAIFPRQMGYSASGYVEAVGDGVSSVKVGDAVAASWTRHSKYIKVEEKNIHKIESNAVSLSAASAVHIATFPMAAIRKCRLEIGESAMVMGLGILGQFAVSLLKAAGAVPVIAVDPVKERREKALKLGADHALDPFDPAFAQTVKSLTCGGVKVAIEVTGNGKALDSTLDCMARFGRVALLGCTRNADFTIDYYRKVHGPGVSLIGAHTLARPDAESSAGLWTHHDDAMAIMRLASYGRLSLDSIPEEMHSPKEAGDVFARLATDPTFPVVQFDWSAL